MKSEQKQIRLKQQRVGITQTDFKQSTVEERRKQVREGKVNLVVLGIITIMTLINSIFLVGIIIL